MMMMKEKYMTDSEILEKYINLDNSCLTESEKVQLRDMIYNIGKCLV